MVREREKERERWCKDVLQWTSSHRRASVGRPTRTYLPHLCTDTGCSLGDLPEAVDDRNKWWEREGEGERKRRSKDVLQWTPSQGCASVGRPTRTYLPHLCTHTGCSLGDLPETVDDRDKWWERERERERERRRVRETRANNTRWWWWW